MLRSEVTVFRSLLKGYSFRLNTVEDLIKAVCIANIQSSEDTHVNITEVMKGVAEALKNLQSDRPRDSYIFSRDLDENDLAYVLHDVMYILVYDLTAYSPRNAKLVFHSSNKVLKTYCNVEQGHKVEIPVNIGKCCDDLDDMLAYMQERNTSVPAIRGLIEYLDNSPNLNGSIPGLSLDYSKLVLDERYRAEDLYGHPEIKYTNIYETGSKRNYVRSLSDFLVTTITGLYSNDEISYNYRTMERVNQLRTLNIQNWKTSISPPEYRKLESRTYIRTTYKYVFKVNACGYAGTNTELYALMYLLFGDETNWDSFKAILEGLGDKK